MYYYEIFVGDDSYQSDKPLTYHSPQKLRRGDTVVVPLKNGKVLGFVVRVTTKPNFATRSVIKRAHSQPLPEELIKLHDWMLNYYPAPSGSTTSLFLSPGSVSGHELPSSCAKDDLLTTDVLPPLTGEQKNTLEKIDKPGLHYVFGQTGSGKTRIYIEGALQAFKLGKSSLILTPEISLTPQLVDTFTSVFEHSVVLFHSRLTPKQRRVLWQKMLYSEEPLVCIGPRSILFMPLRSLGFIALDEEHEAAYKQEQPPHYQALRVASMLAHLHGIPLVAGSATPSVDTYYLARSKNRPILTMQKRVQSQVHKKVIDLKDRSQFTRSKFLSKDLCAAVLETINRGEQVLLFLNRRGTARCILCTACGWQAMCPNCDLPLTYHADQHIARCHTCGHKSQPAQVCPDCSNSGILFTGIGTKAIESEAKRLFPHARIQRFDKDNSSEERFEKHFAAIKDGAVDILIGTQIVVKGLDLPKLSLVGIIVADSGLYMPDYSAEERTFQLITQAIGRVGRGHRPGTTIIQTYQPDSFVVQAAVNEDWQRFYEKEIRERKQFSFPPFCHLLKLTCRRKTRASSERNAQKLADTLSNKPGLTIIGPSPAFHEKSAGFYRWQIIVKAHQRTQLLEVIRSLPAGWSYDIDPTHIL